MKTNPLYLSLLLSLQFSTVLLATQIRYTGGNNSNWSDPGNWESGLPGAIDSAWFDGNSGTPSHVDQDMIVGELYFSGSAARNIRIGNGASLGLSGYQVSGVDYLIRSLGNSNHTINAADASGTGVLRLLSSGVIHIENAIRTITIDRHIGESGGAHRIIKTGEGTLSLLARTLSSDFSGGVELRQGTLMANVSSTGSANNPTSGALGTGTLVFAGGLFVYTGSADGVYHNRLEATGDIHIGNSDPVAPVGTRRTVNFTGDLDLGGSNRVLNTNQLHSTGDDRSTQFSGVISNGGLIKRGVSSVNLLAENSYEGETVIEQGVLRLNGGGSISQSSAIVIHEQGTLQVTNSYELASGQVLKGEGTILGRLRLGEGILDPGMDAVGSLNVDADVWFTEGTIRFELGNGIGDQLIMSSTETRTLTGNTNGGVNLEFIGLEGFVGGEFTLIDASGLVDPNLFAWTTDAFSLGILPDGWEAELSMAGNSLNVSFTQIPEPGYFAGLLLCLLVVARGSRRR